MTTTFKYAIASVRQNGRIVQKQGEVVDLVGDRVLLDFGDEKKPRWYPKSKVDMVEGETAEVVAGNSRQKMLDERFSPDGVPGVIDRIEGRTYRLHEIHKVKIRELGANGEDVEFETYCKAESADFINGMWWVMVRFPVRNASGRVTEVRRREVSAFHLAPQDIPGKNIKFLFKGEIHRVKAKVAHDYDFKTIYKNKKPEFVPEHIKPAPEPTGWNPNPIEEATEGWEKTPPQPPEAPLFESLDYEKGNQEAAALFEQKCAEHNGALPNPLSEAVKFVMNHSSEQHIISARGRIMASKVIMD